MKEQLRRQAPGKITRRDKIERAAEQVGLVWAGAVGDLLEECV